MGSKPTGRTNNHVMELSDRVKKYLISEEAGISDQVLAVTAGIRKKIEELEPSSELKTHPSRGYRYKTVGFISTVFGSKVSVRAVIRIASNDAEAHRLFMSGFCQGEYDYDNQLIRIVTVKANGGKILWADAMSTVQHEMEHLYQTHRSGSALLPNGQNKLIYHKASHIVANEPNYCKYQIAFTIYSSFRFEIAANENSIYGSLAEKGSTFTTQELIELLEEEPMYRWVNDLKKFLKDISSDVDLIRDIDEYMKITYGKSYEWFMKVAKSTISKYTRAFGRAVYKVNKDKQGNVETNTKYIGKKF